MLTNSTTSSNPDIYYSYQQHFTVAVINLETVIREERLRKRIRKSKSTRD